MKNKTMFEEYTGRETLKEHGFQVFHDKDIRKVVLNYPTDLESMVSKLKSDDVFRTKLGDIKQIQNLNFGGLNRMLVDLIAPGRDFDLLNNQYFCKPGHYKETSAHQDNAYFESDSEVYTFWIPLQDVDIHNSCMFYVPGSHKEGLVQHDVIGTNVRTRTGKKGFSLYSSVYKNKDYLAVPMPAGNILVHDKNTMHFSSPNLSDSYRIAITAIVKLK